MAFYIQDPIFSRGYSFHEGLLEACRDSVFGVGVFAFVTSGGVELFLNDSIFEDFMKYENSKFILIVGIDEITNTKTLRKLNEVQNKYGESLFIRVLLHNHKSTLFHPKFTWFKQNDGGKILTGSVNLTEKALRRNIEAFTINKVNKEEINCIENYFETWLQENECYLFPIEDEGVIKKAKENERLFRRTKLLEQKSTSQEESSFIIHQDLHLHDEEDESLDIADFDAWYFNDTEEVLIAQIPNNNNRWSQANFSKNIFETFFGATAGVNGSYRIILRNVNNEGKLQSLEVRPSVSVASSNYRFEINAAKGLAYPDNGRPIAVFIKLSVRMYLYTLAMPNDSYYEELDRFIEPLKNNSRMVREIITVNDLRINCPNLPLWNITI